MQNSAVGSKRKLFGRLKSASIGLTAVVVMVVGSASAANAGARWIDSQWETQGTTPLYVDNSYDCTNHTGPCYGVLAHWNVELQLRNAYSLQVFYENMACVGGGKVQQVDYGYRPSASRLLFYQDFTEKTVTPGWIEDYLDNPCYLVR